MNAFDYLSHAEFSVLTVNRNDLTDLTDLMPFAMVVVCINGGFQFITFQHIVNGDSQSVVSNTHSTVGNTRPTPHSWNLSSDQDTLEIATTFFETVLTNKHAGFIIGRDGERTYSKRFQVYATSPKSFHPKCGAYY